jgi:hypothetical protein
MTKLKLLGVSTLMVISLALSTTAGEIQLGRGTPPPDNPPLTSTTTTDHAPSNAQEAALPLTDVALNVLQDLLILF